MQPAYRAVSSKLRLLTYILDHYVVFKSKALFSILKGSIWNLINWLAGHVDIYTQIPFLNHRRFAKHLAHIRRWHVAAAGFLIYKLTRLLERLARYMSQAPQRKELHQRMAQAATYDDWLNAAVSLDTLLGRNNINLPAHKLRSLHEKTTALVRMREKDDIVGLMWVLRQDSARNVGSLMRQACDEGKVFAPIVPRAVEDYLEEVKAALSHVCNSPTLPLDERIGFVRELRHSYGRTALVLSGGGSFGHFHFGVIRALLQASLLPRVVSGSSAGSIGCALLATRTDEELRDMTTVWIDNPNTDFFGENKGGTAMLKNLFSKGTLHDVEDYIQRLQRLLGNITFEQAYTRSGRILNVAVSAIDTQEPPRLLNYLTAPHVLIWSAVAASSAFPWLFKPQDLYCLDPHGRIVPYSLTGGGTDQNAPQFLRRWADGSLEEDLPMMGLSSMFNVNQFLVSQSNPYLLPILGVMRLMPHKIRLLVEWELKHRMGQLLHIWPRNKLLKLLCQPWSGDVNFVLPFTKFAVHRSAVNFTRDEILKAMQEGQRQVWSKLAVLRSSCAIEVAVDMELRQLTLQSKMQRRRQKRATVAASQSMRRSMPSWLHMQALGLVPTDASNEDVYSLVEEPTGCSLTSISELPGASDEFELTEEGAAGAIGGGTVAGGGHNTEEEVYNHINNIGQVGDDGSILTAATEGAGSRLSVEGGGRERGQSLMAVDLPESEAAFKDVTALIGLDWAAY